MISLRRESHRPPAGARAGDRPLYAIGDIHGCYDLFYALLQEIGRDAAEQGGGAPATLVLLGDYVDRGPASAKVFAALAWLARSRAIEARLLEGNHEEMLRLFLDRPTEHAAWIEFGGRQTLHSYGIAVPESADEPTTLIRLRDELLDVMPTSHHMLLHRLEQFVRAGDYLFVHAGVRPGVPLGKQHRDDLLWIRDEFLDHPKPAEYVIVHGHTWADDRPTLLPHRLCIDTGAYETGVLTGLRIGNDAIEVIQAVRDGSGG